MSTVELTFRYSCRKNPRGNPESVPHYSCDSISNIHPLLTGHVTILQGPSCFNIVVCFDCSPQIHSGDRDEHGPRPGKAVPAPSLPHLLHQRPLPQPGQQNDKLTQEYFFN